MHCVGLPRMRFLGIYGQAKISYFDGHIFREKYVGWFQISMDDFSRVNVSNAMDHLFQKVTGFGLGDLSTIPQYVNQTLKFLKV